MSEGHVSNEAPEIEPEKQSAKPAGVTPADQFVLPSLDQVWPMVMQIYSEVHGQFQGGLAESSPQVQSDAALGNAVTQVGVTFTDITTPIGSQANILFNYTLNNGQNIVSLNPHPPINDEAGYIQWMEDQGPNEPYADLFPTGKDGIADMILRGMSCRQLLISNGWDVSGLTFSTVVPEKPTLYVNGRFLYDRHGNKLVLRGVNYQALDNYNYPGVDYLDEVLKTGANAIRIPWWDTYPDPSHPSFSIDNLTNLIDRCVAANVIPIVEFAQTTSMDDMGLLSSWAVPWWTSKGTNPNGQSEADNGVFAALKGRESCLIINIANELGVYRWADDPDTALSTYTSAYEAAIKAMRAAGYTCPLMIDAPDSGTTMDAFLTNGTGAALVAADPLGNVMLSSHCYWAAYDDEANVPAAVAANLPILFAEVANKEGDPPDNLPIYDLDGDVDTNHLYQPAPTGYQYQEFLGVTLLKNEIGWLAWSWFQDDVPERNMSSDGSFASLTAYGLDITNNPTYGLKATAVRITP